MAANYSDLDRVNNGMSFILLPVIVLVSLCMIIGIFGNSLAILYYGCHGKPTPSNHFIVAMTVFDIIICCVSMPLEIVDMEFPFKFPSKAACKILRFVNYFASISSGLMLVAVAIDRYRKVCQPFKTQITTKMTKVIVAIICAFSFSVSWPAFVLYDVVPVNITVVNDVIGYDCTTVRNRDFKLYIIIYNAVGFLFFLGFISSLIVLYIVIGRKLFLLQTSRIASMKRKRESFLYTSRIESTGLHSESFTKQPSVSQQKSTDIPLQLINGLFTEENVSSTETENSNTKTHRGQSLKYENRKLNENVLKEAQLPDLKNFHKDTLESRVKTQLLKSSEVSVSETSCNISKLKTKASLRNVIVLERQTKVRDQYIHLKKYTVLMLSITTAFVLSFLPHLCLVIWRTLVPQYEGNSLSNSELVAFYMCMRSWLISSVVNPIIYGFFNTDFRIFVSALFHKCFCCI